MKLQELSKMSLAELQQRVDERLARNEDPNASDETKAAYITQAQLYIGEINRRSDDRHARRDFWMEIAVIVLIALELAAGVYEVVETRANANQASRQLEILGKLNKSASDTAATLDALRTAQEASLTTQQHTLDNIVTMNTALQDAMGLNYAIALETSFDNGTSRLNLANKGKTNIQLWGIKLDNVVSLEKEPRVVVPQSVFSVDAKNLVKILSSQLPKGSERRVPLDIYLKSANGKSYIAKCYLGTTWDGDAIKVWLQTVSITQGRW